MITEPRPKSEIQAEIARATQKLVLLGIEFFAVWLVARASSSKKNRRRRR